jgi:CMP-N-acetylneuraminic acid synthetase
MQNNKEQLKSIALICCRGGSKGIPNKNIKDFSGRPMLAWILESAVNSTVFDEIILSTDSEEIAKLASGFGITIPGLRPEHLAKDDSDQFDTHQYIFEKLNITDETHSVCVLNNNPFINEEIIRNGVELAGKNNFQRLIVDAIKVEGDYVFWKQNFLEDGSLKLHYPDLYQNSQMNRQTIKASFTNIFNIKLAKPSLLSSFAVFKQEVISSGVIPCWLPKTRNFDIDDIDDWNIAEAVFNGLFKDKK